MRNTILCFAGIALVIAGVLVPVGTGLVVVILPETYASTVRLVPARTEPAAIATEVEKIGSRLVLQVVATNLDLSRKWAAKFKEEHDLPMDVVYHLMQKTIEIRQVQKTHLIAITAFSHDRQEAANLANEIAKVYRESPIAAKNPRARTTVQIIDQASPGLRPVRPNKPMAIAASLGIGGLLAVMGILLVVVSRKGAGIN